MADDRIQRPYRASEPPVRGSAKTPGSDPLAELARLIGQTDPFAEFGRDSARRAPATPSAGQPSWDTQPPGTYRPQSEVDVRPPATPQRSGGNGYFSTPSAPSGQAHDYGAQSYGRQLYGEFPSATVNDPYPTGDEARGYLPDQREYQDDSYEHTAGQHPEEEYYDDAPSSRRRLGVTAIAGVFALAVVGTAGAFGYRAIFGSSSSSQPPPVIKADTGPSKIVPATTGKDSQSNKLITDRMNERGQSEKLVSREEQPVDKPTAVVLSQPPQSALGTGVIGSEPKKIRTIAIHPDQPARADPVTQARATAAPLALPAAAPKPSGPPARTADNATAEIEQETPPASAARAAPAVRQPPANAPLSLNPNAAPAAASRAPAAAAPAAPARTASVAPQSSAAAANASGGGPGNYVQLSSQRSEAEAQAAFRSLQAKYPTQLGSRTALIHKVELGAKGTYYRAMVGPFANANEAGELCSSLKAAGGQCLIQRN
jgi:hypothetical protein